MKLEGFPKEERVRRSEEFTRILREGKRFRGRFLSAYCLSEDGADGNVNRVGVAAGKRLGKAVLRNRLKRRIREAYRRNKRELPCRGVAIIFLASARMIDQDAREVENEVVSLLRDMAGSFD